jgi:N-acetylneuraminic acid mutarotase
VYVFGGYNFKEGALAHVERFSSVNEDWKELAPMATKRINAGACSLGSNFIYVFGGRSEGDEFYDSIERYSIDMNIWTTLDFKLPKKLSNLYAFPFLNGNQENIVVLGGIRPKEGALTHD